jgi:predicted transcriptional regulator
MTTAEIRTQILRALRYGPLDHLEISPEIDQAPLRIHAELKVLRREGLVRNQLRAGHGLLCWELTERGHHCVDVSDELFAVALVARRIREPFQSSC